MQQKCRRISRKYFRVKTYGQKDQCGRTIKVSPRGQHENDNPEQRLKIGLIKFIIFFKEEC